MKVGDTVYVFDGNHIVYRKAEKGHPTGGPIYREHFVPRKIVGETSRFWLIEWSERKYPKKGRTGLYTLEQVEEACWLNDHKYKIIRELGDCRDVNVIKQVAALMGYKA